MDLDAHKQDAFDLLASDQVLQAWKPLHDRYIRPTMIGDDHVQESDLKRLHEGAIKDDPFISTALGPNAKIERMKAAALRLGSQGLTTSYDDHVLIIGDAAGHIDPLTGEGIHTAMLVSCLYVCQPLGVYDTLDRWGQYMVQGVALMWGFNELQGGKAAAETVLDMRATGDFSKASTRAYERRWVKWFGYDFNNVRPASPLRRLNCCGFHCKVYRD